MNLCNINEMLHVESASQLTAQMERTAQVYTGSVDVEAADGGKKGIRGNEVLTKWP